MRLARVSRRLGDPRLALASHQQLVDDRMARLGACGRRALTRRREMLAGMQRRLAYVHPRAVISRERSLLVRATDRLGTSYSGTFERKVNQLQGIAARLEALSPLAVLARGYAIATRADGRAVRSAEDVKAGERIVVRVATARVEAEVVATEEVEKR
jgi:exodeoxyribonuclease VII large subunit